MINRNGNRLSYVARKYEAPRGVPAEKLIQTVNSLPVG
jgi:hypothetical protein